MSGSDNKRTIRFITDEENAAQEKEYARQLQTPLKIKKSSDCSFQGVKHQTADNNERKLSHLLSFGSFKPELPFKVFFCLQKMNDLSLNFCNFKRPLTCK